MWLFPERAFQQKSCVIQMFEDDLNFDPINTVGCSQLPLGKKRCRQIILNSMSSSLCKMQSSAEDDFVRGPGSSRPSVCCPHELDGMTGRRVPEGPVDAGFRFQARVEVVLQGTVCWRCNYSSCPPASRLRLLGNWVIHLLRVQACCLDGFVH